MSSKKEVVITGIGIVSPLGVTVREFGEKMFAGESGVVSIRGSVVPDEFPVPYAGIVNRELLKAPSSLKSHDSLTESALFAAVATDEALQGAFSGSASSKAVSIDAIIYGSAEGINFELGQRIVANNAIDQRELMQYRVEYPLEIINEQIVSAVGQPVPERDLISINAACATGNQAVGVGMQGIREGRWKRIVVGGVDARCTASNFANFHMLSALTTADVEPHTASRPFSGDRTGFVRGEGAATLVMESRESAEARGAKVLARVTGYGNTTDAYRLTDGRDDGSSVMKAMADAVADSGHALDGVDVISAHGTSTPLNDRLETLAIKKLFGSHAQKMPITALKSQIGHSTVAAGAIEAVAAVLMLNRQLIPPTINLNTPDPECDLDYVPNVKREAKFSSILSNNFGFGGQNACLLMESAAPESAKTS